MIWLLIGMGGALGAWLRFALSYWANHRFGTAIPATFVVNVLGSGVLGYLVTLFGRDVTSLNYALFEIGLMGGFTTFSTFILEFERLRERPLLGLGYIFATITLALAAWLFGQWVAGI
ncbi:MAG: CrcB family protein [Idiomarina sp.]|nr:CrcB family protein [Idiomarina sp.]